MEPRRCEPAQRVRAVEASAAARPVLWGPAPGGEDATRFGGVRLVRHARSRRIGRVATAVGALLVGLAWTTSVAEALVATPDVTLATAVSAGSPGPATSFTWTLVARNSGAATAHDV